MMQNAPDRATDIGQNAARHRTLQQIAAQPTLSPMSKHFPFLPHPLQETSERTFDFYEPQVNARSARTREPHQNQTEDQTKDQTENRCETYSLFGLDSAFEKGAREW